MSDRRTAFDILTRIERDHAYSNLTLDAKLRADGAGVYASAFVTALVYGVLERKLTLDYMLSQVLTKPLKKLHPTVLMALRMGVYQLFYMDKVPANAAVNESVKLVKQNGCAFAAGLVNSVLRSLSQEQPSLPKRETDTIEYLSVRYSCPPELVALYCRDYGEEAAEGILAASLGAPPLYIRVNTLKTDTDALCARLAAEGAAAEHGVLPNTLILKNSGAPERLQAYSDGLFHIQDLASAYCVQALQVQAGQTVYDVCSAPGGKTFTVAQEMQNSGKILAFDLYEKRLGLVSAGAARLGITNIACQVQDAGVLMPELARTADRVLCDVPCSGLGVIRRKPEIRYKPLGFIDNLPQLQYNIFVNAAKYVKIGGEIVYSTCTLHRAENDAVCDRFLQSHPSFTALEPYRTLLPQRDGTDGFFFARFRRTSL